MSGIMVITGGRRGISAAAAMRRTGCNAGRESDGPRRAPRSKTQHGSPF